MDSYYSGKKITYLKNYDFCKIRQNRTLILFRSLKRTRGFYSYIHLDRHPIRHDPLCLRSVHTPVYIIEYIPNT